MTTELLKQALSAMRDVADLMADRWPMDTQQRAPKFFQAMRDIDTALAQPADEDAWLKEARRLLSLAMFVKAPHQVAAGDAVMAHLRARPQQAGFVSVPVEQAEAIVLTGAESDTLIALVEKGPLWDGDVPSKRGRDALIDRGLAVRVVVKGEDGWQAATYAGRDAYKAMFPGPDGSADTIGEAKGNRTMRRAINSAAATKGDGK